LRRLAFDELFANQLALRFKRHHMRSLVGRAQPGDGRLRDAIRAALPFELTQAQEVALGDISKDLATDKRMIRLLQGDVGSGKTVLALLAMAQVVEGGSQAALMAPTEVLARQHAQRLAPFAKRVGIRLGLLVGSERGNERSRVLSELATGAIDVAIGTHALFQAGVSFKDLGLAVVDEQHRFGVRQRLAFVAKGQGADLLSMTATPIPRTLVMAFFGDMDVSDLREKPPGRTPIDTRAVPLDRIEDVIDALERALKTGRRAYWVCPLVEENEVLEVAAAEERAEYLQGRFGDRVGVVHGRMKGADKDAALAKFQGGETLILVATTVVEVGVDVPEASIIIIEQAERFGLAQLHQLRGRVGRGATSSSCILLYKPPLTDAAMARLSILRESEDGFRIAEEDLRLRGEGDLLGVRQSGAPIFRFAKLDVHQDLLRLARDEAEAAISNSPGLQGEDSRALRLLLHLFEREEAIRLLESA
jgi:ATP-dependent DNA helicase RecG